jgi:exosortase
MRPPDDPTDKTRWWMTLVAVGLIIFAYGISKTCVQNERAMSLFGWLWSWWGQGGDYAHGYLVPIVAGALFAWKWRSSLQNVPMETSNAGTIILAAAMFFYWLGVRAANPRIIAGSLVVLVFGLIFYLAGFRWAKALWFPTAFLLFMIPLNFLEPFLSFPLRLFVAKFSTYLLNGLGLEVYRDGTGIYSVTHRFLPLDVADPCSGIRSLVAMMALTAVYGYVTMDKSWKKWVLFCCSIPLAVIGNLARITTVALVAQGFGQELALRIYHDYSGYIVFSLAILCMIALGSSMNLRFRDIIHRWTREEIALPARN